MHFLRIFAFLRLMYLAENKIVASSSPSPFGTALYNRGFAFSDYRYGFNKKEKDDEIKGQGNSYDFGARIQDPRLGRWLSIDLKFAKFPNLSPFSFVNNMPIIAIDPEGKDIYFVTRNSSSQEKPEIQKQNFTTIINTLNSTEEGAKMVQEYINNPKKDLYITIGNSGLDKKHPGSETSIEAGVKGNNTDAKEGIVTSAYTEIGTDTYYTGKKSEFFGVQVDNSKENSFITLSSDEYGGELTNLKTKEGAEVLAHESGAHSENGPSTTGDEGHTKYGRRFFGEEEIRV